MNSCIEEDIQLELRILKSLRLARSLLLAVSNKGALFIIKSSIVSTRSYSEKRFPPLYYKDHTWRPEYIS